MLSVKILVVNKWKMFMREGAHVYFPSEIKFHVVLLY